MKYLRSSQFGSTSRRVFARDGLEGEGMLLRRCCLKDVFVANVGQLDGVRVSSEAWPGSENGHRGDARRVAQQPEAGLEPGLQPGRVQLSIARAPPGRKVGRKFVGMRQGDQEYIM